MGVWSGPIGLKAKDPQKQYKRLRNAAQKRSEQYIKSDFVLFWGPYVLLRSDFL